MSSVLVLCGHGIRSWNSNPNQRNSFAIMALVLDTDALPTIPPTWTAPTSCFASTLYYRVFYNGNFFSNLYGTPTPVFDGNTPIGACIPPSFMINVPFRTDGGCPTGYTTACTSTGASRSGKQLTTVTCCPRYVCRCRFHADVDKIC